ncbi:MAG TPA: cation diffusion facilitator family transporter [Candidatus Acidoferrales bacterium]|nr:cation diffusion facilitator family transporter [Candidatus Acidoferrales bacterium]
MSLPHDADSHHAHPSGAETDQGSLVAALCLIAAFMVAEVVIGVLARSLALLSDAGHMLTDVAALGVSLIAVRLAQRPPEGGLTFGLKRAEILAALVSGATLLMLAAVLIFEAVLRVASPPSVQGGAVIATAAAGVVVNLGVTWQLSRANRRSLNIEASFRHILTDLYALIGTLVAGVVIVTTGFERADALASLLVACLMVYAGVRLLGKAGRVLLEASPADLDPEEIGSALAAHAHVVNVHDLHVWELTSGFPSLSAHVLVHPRDDCHAIRLELERFLEDRFHVEHTTLQVDHAPPEFLKVERLVPERSRSSD